MRREPVTTRSAIRAALACLLAATPAGWCQEPKGPAREHPFLCRAAAGDTIRALSQKYSIPPEVLARNSFLEPTAPLVAGEVLLLLDEPIDYENLGADFVRPLRIEDAVKGDLDGDPEPEIGIIGSSWERDRTQQLVFVEQRQRKWKAIMVYQVRQQIDPCRMSFSKLIGGRPQVVISGREGAAPAGGAADKELYTIILGWSGREGIELFREQEYSFVESTAWGDQRTLESEFAIADRDGDGAPEIERSVHYRIKGIDGPEVDKIIHDDRSKESFHWDAQQKTFYPVEQEAAKLDSPNRAILIRAIERLGGAGARAPATAIERFLRDPYPDVQRAAAHTLGEIGSRSSVDPILARLKEVPPPEIACDLLEALGEIGDPRAQDALRFWMEHRLTYVRGYACIAASRLGMEVRLADIAACLDEEFDHLKTLAVRELTRKTGKDFGTEWTTWKEFRECVEKWKAWWKENAGKY